MQKRVADDIAEQIRIELTRGSGRGLQDLKAVKDPHKFAKNRDRHSNEIGFRQDLCRSPGLMKIVLDSGTNQHVAIGSNFHLAFAHPWVAISFISSIVNFGSRRCARQPRKSVMAPSCATALTTIRPSGNLSASIFSPGLTPR